MHTRKEAEATDEESSSHRTFQKTVVIPQAHFLELWTRRVDERIAKGSSIQAERVVAEEKANEESK